MKKAFTTLFLCIVATLALVGRDLSWENYRPDGRIVTVFEIFRDREGMLWLGTNVGLYSFDGYRGKRVDLASASFNAQIYSIIPDDRRGGADFWLGTNNGVFRYNAARRCIEPADHAAVPEIRAMLLYGNRLMIGSLNGLYIYDTQKSQLSGPIPQLPHNAVYSLYTDEFMPEGKIYVGTYNGLCVYDIETASVEKVNIDARNRPGHNLFVNSIAHDTQRGCLWLGTEGALLSFRPRTGQITKVEEFNGSSVKAIDFTRSGKIVVGTDDGLFIYDDTPGADLMLCRHDSRDAESIADNTVWSLMVDQTGNILAGTEMGLSLSDIDSPVSSIRLADITGSNEGLQIFHFLRDSRGTLWIGGSNGIIRHDDDTATNVWYRPGDTRHPLSHNRVRHISEGADGTIYAATDGAINIYNPSEGLFENRCLADRSGRRNSNWAYSIEEDPADGRLWVGAYLGGVFVADRERVKHPADAAPITAAQCFNSDNGLANDLVHKLHIDECNNKWLLLFRDSAITRIDLAHHITRIDIRKAVGAYPDGLLHAPGGGVWCAAGTNLLRIDASGRIVRTISFPAALSDECVMAMELVGGEIWFSTLAGDVRAVDTTGTQVRLLPIRPDNYTAIYHDFAHRQVLLGTVDRIVTVNPQRLQQRVSTDRLHLVSVLSGDDFADDYESTLAIHAADNRLSVELATFDFTPGISRRFAYRVTDIDTAWTILPDGDNRIVINNLPEGHHRLEMMILDNPESMRSLNMQVFPPWYRSHASIGVYLLAILLILALAANIVRRRQQRRIRAVERQAEFDKVTERIEFLSNISHDLKTPLSMIIGPLSSLRDSAHATDPELNRAIDVAYNNALKLNELIHRTIELNHVEAVTDAQLVYTEIDLCDFCRSILGSYAQAYPDRQFDFQSSDTKVSISTDAVKLESVLNNLLSNAVKYSADSSPIVCRIDVAAAEQRVRISIADHGIGIPEEERTLIFQRMFRSARSAERSEGTGLGLYLVKRYVEMLGGNIEVESHTGRGSIFTVNLPVAEKAAADISGSSDAVIPLLPAPDDDSYRRQRILIVDDNNAIAEFIAELLGNQFTTATAPEGRTALEMMKHYKPDLIIADEMMPVMTGLEMVRHLKATDGPLTSVPVILLTAKADVDLESESVRCGVDMFMAKPFEAPLLRARVEQMLSSRARMRRDARIATITEGRPIEAESDHERQLATVTAAIESHIADNKLGVSMLCSLTGLQSKQLYRLIKRYVGLSPVDYIRRMRLHKAAQLLEQDSFAVSEVMYMVGFSSPGYFSKCFSALHGCTPGQYRANHRQTKQN